MKSFASLVVAFAALLTSAHAVVAAEITVTGGAIFDVISSDIAIVGATTGEGKLVLPRELSDSAEPVVTYDSDYARRVSENDVGDIEAAIVDALFPVDRMPGTFSPDRFFLPAPETALSSDVPNLVPLLRRFIQERPKPAFEPDDLKGIYLAEARYAIAEAATLDDEHLKRLVDEVSAEPAIRTLSTIDLDPTGILKALPNRPNGADGRFYSLLSPITYGFLGPEAPLPTAQTLCLPMKSYWREYDPKKPRAGDAEYLRATGLPFDREQILAAIEKDCAVLQEGLDRYSRYLLRLHNLWFECNGAYPSFLTPVDEAQESVKATVRALNLPKASVDGFSSDKLGVEEEQSLLRAADYFCSAYYSMFTPYDKAQTPTSKYWHAYSQAGDDILLYSVQPYIMRYWIKSAFFAVLPGETNNGFAYYASRSPEGFESALADLGTAANPYSSDVRAARLALAAQLQGLKRPTMLGEGGWGFDASFADLIVTVQTLRSDFERAMVVTARGLLEQRAATVEALQGLARVHRLDKEGTSQVWSPESAIVSRVIARNGFSVVSGQPLVQLSATRRHKAVAHFPVDELAWVQVGARNLYEFEARGELPAPTNTFGRCGDEAAGEVKAAMTELGAIALKRKFWVAVESILSHESDGSLWATVNVSEDSPVGIEPATAGQADAARCLGLPIVTVGGKQFVRPDFGILRNGETYAGRLAPKWDFEKLLPPEPFPWPGLEAPQLTLEQPAAN